MRFWPGLLPRATSVFVVLAATGEVWISEGHTATGGIADLSGLHCHLMPWGHMTHAAAGSLSWFVFLWQLSLPGRCLWCRLPPEALC